MPDTPPPDAPKGSGLFGSVMKGVIGLSLGLLGFVASLIWDGYKEIAQDQTDVKAALTTGSFLLSSWFWSQGPGR